LALRIAQECLLGIVDPAEDRRKQSWNFRNALLYGFGILTTLGQFCWGGKWRQFRKYCNIHIWVIKYYEKKIMGMKNVRRWEDIEVWDGKIEK
jgi:hypothetical protein